MKDSRPNPLAFRSFQLPRLAEVLDGLGQPELRDPERVTTALVARWGIHKMVAGGEHVNRFMPFFKTWLLRRGIAEAARREKVSEQAIGNWKRQFLEGGKAGIEAGKSKPSTREQQLEDEVAELTQALGEAAVEIRVWKKSAEGRLGPSRTSRSSA